MRRLLANAALAFAPVLAPGALFAGAVPLQRAFPEAAEIDAERWFNVEGGAPTLAGLRGKVVLLEFWATW